MKREIKFRAWDNENKCFYEPIHEAYRGNLWELVLNFAGQLDAHTLDGDKIHSSLVHESIFPGRYELMQFTGLKDKNGIDVYEGDLVKVENGSHPLYEISFEGSLYWLSPYPDDGTLDCNALAIGVSPRSIEVTGNIYENPELIKP